MLIKNAGYMWHRKHINWKQRRLFGVPEEGKGPTVNFAEQTAICGLYSANHECIYIGQAGKGDSTALFDRLKAHATKDHLFCFWKRFTWFGFYSPKDLEAGKYDDTIAKSVSVAEALNMFETAAIYLALPRFNRRYESGFSEVTWYDQSEDVE